MSCLKHGADVNIVDNDNQTALHFAASRGHSDVMKELLDCKADINVRDKHEKTPLHYAVELDNIDAVQKCLQYGTPLHYAVELDHLEDIKTCLKYDADVNIMYNKNQTALHLAASRGHIDVLN